MNLKHFLSVALLLVGLNTQAQCPVDEADLADGGTFSGNCNLGVGNTVTITGAVTWTSGILSITSNDGDIVVASTGSLNITGGTVRTISSGSGTIDIAGSVSVSSGATLQAVEYISVNAGGTLTNDGTLTAGSYLYVAGTATSSGTVTTGTSVEVDGAAASLTITGGSLTVGDNDEGDDLLVYNGGTFTLNSGATALVGDDLINNDDGQGGGGYEEGHFIINGTLTVVDNLRVANTTPNSSLFGFGCITSNGIFEDLEATGDFEPCGGGGAQCCGNGIDVLPNALISPTSPLCAATNQTVTVRIRNNGPNTINFATNNVTVGGSVTGPNPATFTSVTLNSGNLAAGATQNVTLSTTYNMSTVGTYDFSFTTSSTKDRVTSNDASPVYSVVINAAVANNTITAAQSFCGASGDPAQLNGSTPTGGNGTYTYQWQSSPDNSAWTNIGAATAINYDPPAITATTYYRRGVSSGSCPTVYSASVQITLQPAIANNTITAGQTFCATGDPAQLNGSTPTGGNGTYTYQWQSSPDNSTWTNIGAATAINYDPATITTTTYYRRGVSSGACTMVYSASVQITIQPAIANNTITAAQSFCGASGDPVQLNGSTPTGGDGTFAYQWQSSPDNSTWTDIGAATAINYDPAAITSTTYYRRGVSSGTCTMVYSASVQITVNPSLGNNTITAAQTFCGSGNPAQLNGSAPTGGAGTGTYTYQWQVSLDNIAWANIPATNTQNYDPPTVSVTTHYRRGVSSGACAMVYSASVQITIQPAIANNTITAAQSFCGASGDPAQLNGSTPTGGDGTYAYQWQSSPDNSTWTNIGAATAINYDPAAITSTTYYRRGVSSGSCAMAYSASVQITIDPSVANNTITAAQTFCATGDPAQLNGSTPTGGNGTYAYQWQSSPDNSTWTNIGAATAINYDPATITSTTYYRRGVSSGACSMVYSTSVQITIEPAIANNTITAAQTFCAASGDPAQLNGSTPTGGNGTFAYQWQSSPDNSTWTNIGAATAVNYDPATITSTTYYRRGVSSGACAMVYSASVQITINPALANNTISADQTFCASGDPAQLNGSMPTGGTGVYGYQWEGSPDNVSWFPIPGANTQNYDPPVITSGGYARRIVTSGSCPASTSNTVTIIVEPAIANNTVTAAQTFCGSGDPAQLNGSTPTGGNGTYSYQWQSSPDNSTWTDIGLANGINYDPSTISATTYYRRGVTSGTCTMVYSASVQITIQPAIANNTISAAQTFCASGDPVQLTGSTPTGGNGTYTYQWQSSPDNSTWTNIAATNTINYDPSTIASTTYYRRGVSSGSCTMVYSASVQITIEPAIANNTISAAQTFCSSGDPAQLTGSTPTGGNGSSYTYQWQSSPDNSTWTNIAATNTQSYDPATISSTTYYRRGVSSGICAMVYSASVQITIEPALANNTITANQTFCGSGDPAQLNGSTPTGGTGTYAYQWQSSPDNATWSNVASANAMNYDPASISSTTYYRRGVSSGSCAMVYSASVQITIQPAIANNTISAAQTFCASGDPAQLNGSTPTGGTGVYTYQWQSSPDNSTWTNIAATNTINYDPSTISATTYYRRGVSSGVCTMVYSTSVQITVQPAIANNTISAAQTFCGSGDPAQLNGATPTGGDGTYTYQWQSSPDNASWMDIGFANGINYDPGTISSTTYYRRGVSSGVCTMVYSTSVQITIQPAIANNTISAAQTFCASGDPAQLNGATPTGGNGTFTYQWQSSPDDAIWTNIGGATSINYNPSTISSTTYYRRGVSSGACAMVYSASVEITIEPAIANNTIGAPQTFCGNSDPAELTGSVPTGGNGSYVYQWQSSPDNATWADVGGATGIDYDPSAISSTTYYRRGVSSGTCAIVYSSSVQITIQPSIANNTIASAQTFCVSGDPAQLNGSTPTGGNGTYAYQWQSSPDNSTWTNVGGATSINYDPGTLSATTYYRRGVSSGACIMVYSASVQITIEPAITNNIISADQTFCTSGDPAVLVGAAPSGGSGTYTYQWQISSDNATWSNIGGATLIDYDPSTTIADTYYRRGVSSGTCTVVYSNSVYIKIEPAITNNTISAPQTFCGNGDPAVLTGSAPAGGNGVFSYQWQSSPDDATWTDIGGANSINYDPASISVTTYYRRGVSSGACVAVVYSASVGIIIEPAIANNTISAAQSFCVSGNPAQLNGSTPTGGNGTFSYQWQSSPDDATWTDIGGATAVNYDPSTISATTYYRRGVSSGACAMVYSSSVQVTIFPAIAANTIASDQTFCGSGDPAVITGSLPTGGTGTYTYQWQASLNNVTWANLGGVTTQSYDPASVSATIYLRRIVNSGSCTPSTSASVVMTVESVIANNTISAAQTFCGSGDPAQLTGSVPTGGNGTYAYQWQSSPDDVTWTDIGAATAVNYNPSTISATTYYRRGVSSGSCSFAYSSSVQITIQPDIANNTIGTDQAFCTNGDPAQLNGSTPTGGNGVYSYQWQSSADDATWTDIGGATSMDYDPASISSTTYYRRGVSSGSCNFVYSASVEITIEPAIANNTIGADQTFCGSGDPAALTGSAPTGGNGTYAYQWQSSPDNATWTNIGFANAINYDPASISSTTYYRRGVSSGSCAMVYSASVQITIQPAIANNTIGADQTFCGSGDPAALTGSVPTGGNGTYAYQWQSSPDNATWTNIGGATSANYDPASVSDTTYYRRGVSSGSCAMVYSTSVEIIVEPAIANNTISADQTFCANGNPALLTGSVPTGGNGTYTYDWESSPDNVTWTSLGANSQDYDPAAISSTMYYRRGVSSGSCAMVYSAPVQITIEPAIAGNTISADQTFCAGGDPAPLTGGVPTGGNGTYTYDWESSPDNATWTSLGVATASYDPSTLTATTYYRRGVSSGSCAMVYSASVRITIEPAITNNIISTDQTFCTGGDPSLLVGAAPSGGNAVYAYQWQISSDNTSWANISGATSQDFDPGFTIAGTYYRREVTSGTCAADYSNSVHIKIEPAITNNFLPAAGNQTFCVSGDPVLIDGATPAGGNGTFTFIWESSPDNATWTQIGGANGEDYDPVAVSDTTYFRRGVSSGSCAVIVYTNSVEMLIQPAVAGNTIGSDQTFCASGNPALLTGSVPTGGSGTYFYEWIFSTDNATWSSTGATSANYDPSVLTDTTYFKRVVTSGSCPDDTSAAVTITVIPAIANNTIAADQVLCGTGDPAALTGTMPTGGNGSYTYNWLSSSDNATWTSLGVATAGYDPATLSATTYYRRVVSSAMCTADSSASVAITVEPPVSNNSISANQSYCGDTDPAQLTGTTPSGGTGIYFYEWLESTDNSTWSSTGATSANYDPGMLTVTTYYKRVVSSGTCGDDTSAAVTITIQPTLTNNSISANQTYCGNTDPASLMGTLPAGGNGTYVYNWQSSSDNVTFTDLGVSTQHYDPATLSATTYFRRLVSAGGICPQDTSNVVTINIQQAIANNTISANQTYCGTSDPAQLTGTTPTGGTGIYFYEWLESTDNVAWVSTGATTANYDPATLSVTTYFRRVVSSGICVDDTSAAVTITISPSVLNNTISASQTFCASGNPANLVGSAPTGGNGTYTYDWQSSPDGATWTSIGVTTQSYDPPVTTTTTYFRRGVSSGSCLMSYSTPVTITVHPAITGNTIASSQTFCGSGDPANLVGSTPTGGTGTYGYAWQFSIDNIGWFNLGVNTQSYDPPTVNSTIYLRRGVTSAPCPANFSASVTLLVEPPITNNTISADQTFCGSGDPAALVGSSPAGGDGVSYTYQWQSSADAITWTDIAGATAINYDPATLTDTTYYRRGVSSNSCVLKYSDTVAVIIQPAIANNTITSHQTFCVSGDPANLVGAIPTGGDGMTYTYQWQSSLDGSTWSNIASATSIDYDPAAVTDTTYFRRGVSSGTCGMSYSDSVEIIIQQPVAGNTISADQTFCVSGDPALLTGGTVTGGTGIYFYEWLVSTDNVVWTSTGETTANYDPATLTDTTYFRRVVSSGVCADDTSASVRILIYPALTNNTISSSQTFCASGDPAILTGTAPAGASGVYTYNWITSADNVVWTSTGVTTANYDPATLTDTTYFRRVVSSGVCADDTSNLVTIIVTPGIAGNTISADQTFCVSGDPAMLTGGTVTGGTGVYFYEWLVSADNTTWTSTGVTTANYDPATLTDTTYFRRVVSSGVCADDTSASVRILVYPALSNNTISTNQTFCGSGDPAILTGTAPAGASGVYTYNWITSTNNVVWTSTGVTTANYDPATLTDTTYFRRVVSSGACADDTSNLVTIIVTPGIAGNTISGNQTFCVSGDPAMLTGGTVTGGNGVYAYTWITSTDNVVWTSTGVTTANYDPVTLTDTTYFRRIVSSGVCADDTSNLVTIIITPGVAGNTISGNQAFCVSGDPAVLTGGTVTGGTGVYFYEWLVSTDNVVWTSTGETTANYDPATVTDTTYFRRVVSSGACADDTSNTVTILVQPALTGNTITANQTFCGSGDPAMLMGSAPSGASGVYAYDWITSTDNVNWVSTGVTTANYDPATLTDTAYFRRVVMSGACANDTSNLVTIIVQPGIAGNTISGNQTFCGSGDPALLTGGAVTGGTGVYFYEWLESTDNVNWISTGVTTANYNPGMLTDTTYYRRVVVSGVCADDTSNSVTILIHPTLAGNTISANQIFCGSGDPALLTGGTVTGGTGTYTYDWITSTDNVVWTSTGITTASYDPATVTDTTYFRRVVISGACTNDTSNLVSIIVQPGVSGNTINGDQTFCGSGDPALLTGGIVTGGTGVYFYEWLESSDNVTWASTGITTADYNPGMLTDTTYFRRVVSSGVCADDTSNSVTILVQPVLAGNTISADQTFCGSGDPALLTGGVVTGGTGTYTYDWISSADSITWVSTGVTTANYDPATVTDTTYLRRIVRSGTCSNDTSNTITIFVQPAVAGNTISGDQTFCGGGDPAMLTGSAPTGGNGIYVYDWISSTDNVTWVSTGVATANYDPAMLTDTTYFRRIVISGACSNDTSNTVTILVEPGVAGNTISGNQTFCGNGDPVALAGSLPTGGTGVYFYEWLESSDNVTWTSTGVTTQNYDPAVLTDTTYFRRVVISGACMEDTSASVSIIIAPALAGNTISADQTFCGSGDPALLTGAVPTGGAGTYVYDWISSTDNVTWTSTGVTTQNYDPTTLTDTTYFRRVVISGACANDSSNVVTIFITPGIAGNTISGNQSFCTSGDPALLTGTVPTGGTGVYFYEWLESSDNTTWTSTGATTQDYDPAMLSATTYYRRVVASGTCSDDTSAAVTITISTAAVADAGTDSTTCASALDLYAVTPPAGTGKWTVIAGTGTFADDTDPATNVTGLSAGVNSFEWVVTQPGCTDGKDTVHITVSSTLAFTLTGTNACGVATNGTLSFNAPAGYSYGYSVGAAFTGVLNMTTVAGTNTITGLDDLDYTVRLQDPAGCFADETYSILADAAPNIFNVTPTGTVAACQGLGIDIGLNGSENGIVYQLQLNGTDTGAPVIGSTESFDFPTQYLPGTYTVTATNGSPACLVNMNGSVTVTMNDRPTVDSVDFDCSGGVGSASVTTYAQIATGTLEYSINGTTFQSSSTFTGLSNGTYNVIAREVTTHCSDTLSVTVTCNTPPVAIIDFGCSNANGSTTISLLPNDFDPNGDDIYTQRVLSGAGTSMFGGSFTLDTLGNLSYLAPANYVGIDTVTYQVCDITIASECATGKVAIKVSNARPVANSDTASVNKNMEYASYVSVLANDSTTDGGVFTIVPVTSGTSENGGTFTIDNAGNFTYTPATDYVGEDRFMYIIMDRCHEDTGYVNIQIDDIFIPEGFSPNGDGSHDYFVIEGGEGYKIDIKVFNRWGSMVYEMDDYKSPDWWDGTANTGLTIGERLPDGTYYYIIDLNDGKKPRVRYITIKR